jgi:hypothetical protein
MADFSKQYAERYDLEMPWDFDIEEIFEEMPLNSFKPLICEGFGFWGLHKEADGKRFCLFGEEWARIPYEEITDETHLKYINK